MRKITVLMVALSVALFAIPASATPPLHERFEISGTFDPGDTDEDGPGPDEDLSFGSPEMCDFDYVQSWYGIANVTTWGGDPEQGTFDRQIWTGPVVVTHTNLTDDFTLVEKASYVIILEDNGATDTEAGVWWHLRDPVTGKLVLVMAGRVVFDNVADTVTFTPNMDPDFWSVICHALGGEPL